MEKDQEREARFQVKRKAEEERETAKWVNYHFFKDGKRIEGKDLTPIYNAICDNFDDSLQQVLSYSWGIHIGLATSRTKVTFRRRKP